MAINGKPCGGCPERQIPNTDRQPLAAPAQAYALVIVTADQTEPLIGRMSGKSYGTPRKGAIFHVRKEDLTIDEKRFALATQQTLRLFS